MLPSAGEVVASAAADARAPCLGVRASPARVLWGLVAAVGAGLDEANIVIIIHTLALQLAGGGDAAWCAVLAAQALASAAPPSAWLPPELQLEEGDSKLTMLSSLLFGCAAGSHRLDGGSASAVAAAVAAAAAATPSPSPAAIHQAVTLTTRAAAPPLPDTACRDLWRSTLSMSSDDDDAPACPPPALVAASGAADAAAFTAAHAPSLLASAMADLAAARGDACIAPRALGMLLPCLDAATLATILPSLLTSLAPTFGGDDAVLQARLLHTLTVMAATPAGATALRGGAVPKLASTLLAPALAQRRRGGGGAGVRQGAVSLLACVAGGAADGAACFAPLVPALAECARGGNAPPPLVRSAAAALAAVARGTPMENSLPGADDATSALVDALEGADSSARVAAAAALAAVVPRAHARARSKAAAALALHAGDVAVPEVATAAAAAAAALTEGR